MESIDIGQVTDGDEILAVEFKCGARQPVEITAAPTCGREIVTVGIEEMKTTLDKLMDPIFHNQCPRCGEYSGFNLLPEKPGIKGEERQRRAATPADLKRLYALLTENLKHPSTETLWMLRTLLEGRNLKLRFQVTRQE